MRRIIITDHERKRDRFEIEYGHRVYVANGINQAMRRARQIFSEPPTEDEAAQLESVLKDLKDARQQLETASIKPTPGDKAMAELPGRLQALKERIRPHGNDAE